MEKYDVIIIGAGAAGLMCAIETGKRARKVLVLDHANKPGKKILMSGGGRCNFTNLNVTPDNFISNNPHFCKSALSRYSPQDFISLVKKYHIPFHEKTLGQLFCDHKAHVIVDMLLSECEHVAADVRLNTTIENIEQIHDHHFKLHTTRGDFHCESLVIASGGLSIPTMGASAFGYKVAEQFGIQVWPTRAGLVPLTLHTVDKDKLATLSGVSVDTMVSHEDVSFRENSLFTHRGLSGPAILQISSYWNPGDYLTINVLPDLNFFDYLKSTQQQQGQKYIKNILYEHLPKRVVDIFLEDTLAIRTLASLSHSELETIAKTFNEWRIKPNGTEGYRTAEVTLGGVDCNSISSKTFEAMNTKGLYFIGEVLDVTGWLGGYNFQWAWASGWAAGQVV